MKLDNDVLAVLRKATLTTDSVKLNGQLERKLYVKVNKALEAAAGIWNRKRGAHIFKQDPHELFNLETGEVLTGHVNGAGIAHAVANGNAAMIVPDLFPTPPGLAARMVQLADIRGGDYVLEPSAGTGAILSAINARPNKAPAPIHVTAVEINEKLSNPLEPLVEKNFCLDFMLCGGAFGRFNKIIMNPPFSKGQDIAHILHAYDLLGPHGRLVAICANGSRQNEKLKPFALSHHGTWEVLPPNTFKESGTGVSAVLMTAEAPPKDSAWNLDENGEPIPIAPKPECAAIPNPITLCWQETHRQQEEFRLTAPWTFGRPDDRQGSLF